VILKTDFKRTGAGPKACRIENLNQGLEAYRSVGGGDVVLEEWIPGTDRDVYFCLQAYDANSERLGSLSGRKIRQWPPLVGGTASAEPVDLPELEEATTRFFRAVRYRGLGSMEYKFDARDRAFYAIEPTVGRTDFQSGLAPANGVNLPLCVFRDMAGIAQKPMRRRFAVKWVNTVGDTRAAWHYMEKGELTRGAWRKSLAGPKVTTLFSMDDPGPWVSDRFRRILGRLKRLRNKEGDSS
jgi:predicted ATP-grasp superfamily ATP-dependent carboligase